MMPIRGVRRIIAALVILGLLVPPTSFAQSASSSRIGTMSGYIEEARRLAKEDRADEAVALLDEAIATFSAEGDVALFNRGLILFSKLGKNEEAIASFLRLTKNYPESPLGDDAMYYAGFLAQHNLNNPARAVELYREGYDKYPAGDFRLAIADKIRELTGESPAKMAPATAIPAARPAPSRSARDTVPTAREKNVLIQFEKAPLRTFIQWVAEVTGRNFIVDDDIAGEITVYSGRQVPFSEVYPIFLSILEIKGFAAIESGDVTKIVTRATATQSELPIVLDDEAEVPTDRVVTRIFQLRSIAAASLMGILRPLLSPMDQIIAQPETNNLIITGPGSHVARLGEMIRILDTERTPPTIRTYRIVHARAIAVTDKLTAIVGSLTIPGAPPLPFKVVPDERTNTIYVLADDVLHTQIRNLLVELDVDRTASRIVRVFNLRYASAAEVVRQLRLLIGLDAVESAPDFGGVAQTVLIADPRLNSVSLSTFAPRVVDLVENYIQTIDRPPTDSLRTMRIIRLQYAEAKVLAEMLNKVFASAAATAADAAASAAPGLADRVLISADDRTNSLLVTATAVDWPKLEAIIHDLDIRKSQVVIDAVVLETNLDEARNLGASLMTADLPEAGKTVPVFRSDPVGFLPTYQSLLAQGGLSIGVVQGQVVGAMLNALMTSSHTNVLQMPQILALDNEEAILRVGNLTPIVTSRSVSGDNVQIGGNSSIFQNVEYRNIGLNLRLKPHIGNKGDILIESRLEIQNRNTQAEVGLNLPVFTTREIQQKFQIADGDYIILGGLLRTQDEFSQRETPWLARIPILGALFKSTRSAESKTVLLIFLRPRIVTDPAAARAITEEERLQYEMEAHTGTDPSRSETDKWIPR